MANQQCAFIKPDGNRCGGYAVNGKDFCFTHEPSLEEAKKEAVKRGGESHSKEPLPPIEFKGIENFTSVIEEAINRVRARQLSAREASAIKSLLDTYTRSLKIWK